MTTPKERYYADSRPDCEEKHVEVTLIDETSKAMLSMSGACLEHEFGNGSRDSRTPRKTIAKEQRASLPSVAVLALALTDVLAIEKKILVARTVRAVPSTSPATRHLGTRAVDLRAVRERCEYELRRNR